LCYIGGAVNIRTQEILGGCIAAAGIIWFGAIMTADFSRVALMRVPPPGPLELCGLGVVIWLIAKWRRSIRLK
jgi:hypothetical protein